MKHRIFVALLIFSYITPTWAAPAWLEQIQESLLKDIGGQLTRMADKMALSESRQHIDISYLDPRLNLSVCKQALSIQSPQPLKLGRSHIKVSCSDKKGWAINVPVDILLYAPVVTLNQPLTRGSQIKAEHLSLVEQNLSSLRNGYFLKKELVIGKQSKRSLAGHTVINSHLILPSLLIRKGDHVMIMASKGAMSVKMPGEALNDGREGRQIRVKNTRSQRIIKGTVIAAGLVRVNF